MMDDYKRAALSYSSYINCRALYVTTVTSFDAEQQMNQQRANTDMLVLQFLFTCLPHRKFVFPQFTNIIMESSSRDNFDFFKLSEAFINLENYIVLLYIMPWKQEYHQIKKFGGYYQTKIESHLQNAENVLHLIGFKEVRSGVLSLTEGINMEILQNVAFDCLVSAVECRIMGNIWKRTKEAGANVRDVVRVRMENRGSEDNIVEIILDKCRKTAVNISGNVPDGAEVKVMEEKGRPKHISSSEQFRDKLQTHMQTAKKLVGDIEDIPFMDDNVKECEYTPVDMDEQMIASLKLINRGQQNSEHPTRIVSGMKPSQEWSFVREKLEKNFGKQYYEGLRKDILSKDSGLEVNRNDPNYIKVSALNPPHSYVNTGCAGNDQLLIDPSVGRDSDYATASTAMYPQTVEESRMMRARGMPSMHTDTVLSKGRTTDHYEHSLRPKTEPIARRQQSEPIPAHVTYQNLSSVDNYSKPSESRGNAPTDYSNSQNATKDYSNIQKYQKNAVGSVYPSVNRSGPIQSNPTQYLPVVQNSSGLGNRLGSQSYSENMKRNVNMPDSSLTRSSRAVHSAPLQMQSVVLPAWSCSFCTYLNQSNSVICEMCSKTPEGTEVDAACGQTSRICDQCTLENEKNAAFCHACGHRLKGAQTCV